MLRMKYLVTLTLVALLMASGAAFAGPWIQLEYVPTITTTSVPIPTDYTEPAFGDVPSTGLGEDEDQAFWAWAQIEECAATHTAASDFIVQGYGGGVYAPSFQVTRAQMAVFVARAAGYIDDVEDVSFGDVPDSYWAYTEIEQCVLNDVVKGYADYFGADDPETTDVVEGGDAYLPTAVVDRAQMAVYIYRAAGLSTVAYQGLFDDVADDNWAALEIEACVGADIVQGYGGGIYLPGNTVTRAQMAVFVWRGLVRGDGDVVLGGPAVTSDTDWIPGGGDDSAQLFYPDIVDTATGCVTTEIVEEEEVDLAVEPGAVVFVVLDAAQIAAGDIDFEVTYVKDGIDCTMADTGELVTSTAHGLLVGDTITFGEDVGGVDPDAEYYVMTVPSANTFTVSDDEGDTTFDITEDGDNTWSGTKATVAGGAFVTVAPALAKAGVNVAGVPYLLASYQVDNGLAAEDYTLTLTLPNGNVTTWEFTVE